jgi:4'-phosphopantetheinyl transferase EntD
MVQGLLPREVAWVACAGDEPTARLFPEEAVQIAGAIETRRREFATARHCARQALARLGYAPTPIPRGPNGEPIWPAGIVGSITHCRGYRAAAVARSTTMRAIGIDAEPCVALPQDVRGLVLRPEEQRLVSSTGGEICWDLVVFAAKECVFKVWFPLTGTWLDHGSATVSWNARSGTFRVELLDQLTLARELGLSVLCGRYAISDGILIAAVAVWP